MANTKQKKHGIDYEPMRIAFINSSKTYEQVAEEFGCNLSTLKSRGANEGWMAQRDQIRLESSRKANEALARQRQEQLEQMNKADIGIANGIRNEIITRLQEAKDREETDPKDPTQKVTVKGRKIPMKELRSLASAAMSAQKISRLVIGAVTDVFANEHSGPGGIPIQAEVYMTAEQQQAVYELLDQYTDGPKEHP